MTAPIRITIEADAELAEALGRGIGLALAPYVEELREAVQRLRTDVQSAAWSAYGRATGAREEDANETGACPPAAPQRAEKDPSPAVPVPSPPAPPSPAVEPAAPPPARVMAPGAAGSFAGGKWTEARMALLRELWPTDTAIEGILARINELPGVPVASVMSVWTQASAKGLGRRPGASARLAESGRRNLAKAHAGAAAKREAARDAEAPPDGATVATYDQIATWSAPRGIPFTGWVDLPRVNAKRTELGLPPFARKPPGAGR